MQCEVSVKFSSVYLPGPNLSHKQSHGFELLLDERTVAPCLHWPHTVDWN